MRLLTCPIRNITKQLIYAADNGKNMTKYISTDSVKQHTKLGLVIYQFRNKYALALSKKRYTAVAYTRLIW